MKTCRCSHGWLAHQHFNLGTYCAYWHKCGCDKYRRHHWWRRLTTTAP